MLSGAQVATMVDGWLRQLGGSLNMRLGLDARGACSLRYRGDLECNVEVDAAQASVYFHAPLDRLPAADRLVACERALALALFGRGTAGAHLGLDPRSDRFVIAERHEVDAWDALEFGRRFARFVSNAARVRETLRNAPQPALPDGSGPPLPTELA